MRRRYGVALVLLAGCSLAKRYKNAQDACVDESKTPEQSDACRARLRVEHVEGSDGGPP